MFGNQGGASGMVTRNTLELSYDSEDRSREQVLEFACSGRTKKAGLQPAECGSRAGQTVAAEVQDGVFGPGT